MDVPWGEERGVAFGTTAVGGGASGRAAGGSAGGRSGGGGGQILPNYRTRTAPGDDFLPHPGGEMVPVRGFLDEGSRSSRGANGERSTGRPTGAARNDPAT